MFCFLGFIVVVLAIILVISSSKRREGFSELAKRLNLNFNGGRDYTLGERFSFLKQFHQGENRYATNVVSGLYQGNHVLAFDFHYETHYHDQHGRHVESHWFSFFILTLPGILPALTIRREGIFTKIAEAFGYQDIKFESAEFSNAFCVRSPDKKFAYDVCNAGMMEFLLANRDLSIEIENQVIGLAFKTRLSVAQFEFNLRRLVEVRSRLPEYLFSQKASDVPPPLPQMPPPLPADPNRARADELQTLAARLAFSSFNSARDNNFLTTWNFLKRLSHGSDRYIFNLLQGTYQEQQLFIFDYHYQTGSNRDAEDHSDTILMLVMRQSFPQLSIGPESALSKIAMAFDRDDIKFESEEFSRIFRVHSPDKKFAYDVCNPQMIEYLLNNHDLDIEIAGTVMLLAFVSQLPADKIEFNLQRFAQVRSLLPNYLFS
jgi:hypothetical protein